MDAKSMNITVLRAIGDEFFVPLRTFRFRLSQVVVKHPLS
jgi:hypothetical protein